MCADDDDGVHVYAECEDGAYSDTTDSEDEIAVCRLIAFFPFFTSHTLNISVYFGLVIDINHSLCPDTQSCLNDKL